MPIQDDFFVVTGGPGAGKTALLSALSGHGYRIAPEAGRAIIRTQKSIGGAALPWKDPLLFAEMMLCWELRSYEEACAAAQLSLFDRGLPDVVGYLSLLGLPIPAHFRRSAKQLRYNRQVFILPPWQDIFRNDDERAQSWDEAVATHDAMVKTYDDMGYELKVVPPGGIEERCRFVLAHV